MTLRAILLCAQVSILGLLTGCNTARSTTFISGEPRPATVQSGSADTCEVLSGYWGAFETPRGYKEEMCGDTPCGYAGPVKLSCVDGRVSGSVLLSVDSRSGKDYHAPIDAIWKEGKLRLTYTKNQRCTTTYNLSMKGADLLGEYAREGCGDEDERGRVILKKYPFGRFKEKL